MDMRLWHVAKEWAKELSKFRTPEEMKVVSKVTAWGFQEVERGRNPDTVLKEVLAKIKERLDADNAHLPVSRVQPPHGGGAQSGGLGQAAT